MPSSMLSCRPRQQSLLPASPITTLTRRPQLSETLFQRSLRCLFLQAASARELQSTLQALDEQAVAREKSRAANHHGKQLDAPDNDSAAVDIHQSACIDSDSEDESASESQPDRATANGDGKSNGDGTAAAAATAVTAQNGPSVSAPPTVTEEQVHWLISS